MGSPSVFQGHHCGCLPEVVKSMAESGLCFICDIGEVYENSVLCVLKEHDAEGPQRLIFFGTVGNISIF